MLEWAIFTEPESGAWGAVGWARDSTNFYVVSIRDDSEFEVRADAAGPRRVERRPDGRAAFPFQR